MKRFLFSWGLGMKVMQVLVLILVMLVSWMSPGAVVEVQAHHESRFMVSVLLTGLPGDTGETVKDLYGFTGPILKDTCISGMTYAGNESLFSAINKQQAAYKAAREDNDLEAAATLAPLGWVEAWMYIRLGKDLIDSVNPVDGIDSGEKAALSEAFDWYEEALETAGGASHCKTNSLSESEVQAQTLDAEAKARSGLLYIARCNGEKPWPVD